MPNALKYDITKDNEACRLSRFAGRGPAFVTFGETMVRDTPADGERPERTRQVHLSMAGSEYTLAMGLARLGIPASYITRVPDNPYGRMLRNIARENGVDTSHFVWAPKTEPIGRFIYEIGRTPRRDTGVYQRMFSAASKLDAGMVDWQAALKDCQLFHTSGITFGLAAHSQYERNYLLAAFEEAMTHKPAGCLVGMDFNYRATLWSPEQAKAVLTPLVTDHIDVLVTTIEDMAQALRDGLRAVQRQANRRRRHRPHRGRRHPRLRRRGVRALRHQNRRHHHPLPGHLRAASLGIGSRRR